MRWLSTLIFALVFSSGASRAAAASVDGLNIYSASSRQRQGGGGVGSWLDLRLLFVGRAGACVASRYRVITLDLPGHGRSDAPKDGKFSMDLFARAVEAVRVEARRQDRAGRPQHGRTRHPPVCPPFPDHVSGLVAVDGPLDMRQFGDGFKPPALRRPRGPQSARGHDSRDVHPGDASRHYSRRFWR